MATGKLQLGFEGICDDLLRLLALSRLQLHQACMATQRSATSKSLRAKVKHRSILLQRCVGALANTRKQLLMCVGACQDASQPQARLLRNCLCCISSICLLLLLQLHPARLARAQLSWSLFQARVSCTRQGGAMDAASGQR